MDKKLIAVRKRLLSDFPFYSKSALQIRTKDGDIKPLKLNPAQKILQQAIDKQMAEEGKIRIIILKARQQGLSTMVGGYLYFSVSQLYCCYSWWRSHWPGRDTISRTCIRTCVLA